MTHFTADHRPWPKPDYSWSMAQIWHDLTFLHWPIPLEVMRSLVPKQLPLDTWNNEAWVAIVPFRMSGIRPRFLPAVPWLSAFLELNVRTYVTLNGKPGVYFFSLDAANPVAVEIARGWFSLPYFRAHMTLSREGEWYRYGSTRTDGRASGAELVTRYRPVGSSFRAEKGSFEHWLTERYSLYTVDKIGAVARAEIDHLPWPLQTAEVDLAVNTMGKSHGILLPDIPPIAHFSLRQDVVVWNPVSVEAD